MNRTSEIITLIGDLDRKELSAVLLALVTRTQVGRADPHVRSDPDSCVHFAYSPENGQSGDEFLTPEELAKKLKVAKATVYSKLGRLGEDVGVYRWGPRCTRIEWAVFREGLRTGKVTFRGKD